MRHLIWFLCLAGLISLFVVGIWAIFPLIPKGIFGTNWNETVRQERELAEAEKNLTICEDGKVEVERELVKFQSDLETSERQRENLRAELKTIKTERYEKT